MREFEAVHTAESVSRVEEAAALHRELVVIDMCTFFFRGYTAEIAASGATALNLTVADPSADFSGVVETMERHARQIESDPAHLILVRRAEDIIAAKQTGRVGLIFGLQNAALIGRDLGRVQTLKHLGLRVLQLTYNERNLFGDGCLETHDGGLSHLGRALIQEMNRLGIVLDLSHAGHRTSLEAIEASERPSIISHANPGRLIPNPRNLSDDQAKAVAASGGVVGVCGWGPICWRGGEAPPGVTDFVDYIEYYVELVGINHVGIGTDSPAGGLSIAAAHAAEINALYPQVTRRFVDRFGEDLETRYAVPVWALPRITEELARRGYAAGDIAKVMGGNFLRVLQEVWV